jgi:hypothetical protein
MGMPHARFTYVPHPVSNKPAAECRRYLEGNDPLTGKPVVEEIAAALTVPLAEEDKRTGFVEESRKRLLEPDTADNLQRKFLEKGQTDGLPIVLPTEEKVSEMLRGTSRKPDEIVGQMRPSPAQAGMEVHGGDGCSQFSNGWGQTKTLAAHFGFGFNRAGLDSVFHVLNGEDDDDQRADTE